MKTPAPLKYLFISFFLMISANFAQAEEKIPLGENINLECMKIRDNNFGRIFDKYFGLINEHVYTLEIRMKLSLNDKHAMYERFNKIDDYYEERIRYLTRIGAPTSACIALTKELHQAVYEAYRSEVCQLKGMTCE